MKFEIINKYLEAYLTYFLTNKHSEWSKWLHLEEWWYNLIYDTQEKNTPFLSLYCYEPPKCKGLVINHLKNLRVNDKILVVLE